MCKDCALKRLKEGCDCFESEPIISEAHELFFRLADSSINVMSDYMFEVMIEEDYTEDDCFPEEDYYDIYQEDLLDCHEHNKGHI